VNKISGAVERVDYPAVGHAVVVVGHGAFFGHEASFGKEFLQALNQHFFGLFVDVGHQVMETFSHDF
jgi:hypothetical protein